MDLKYSQIAQLAQFSNDKMVDVIKNKLAESENAAVALVFDDSLIVLDENNEQFYAVDYTVENRALNLANWDPIKVQPDDQTRIEELAESYFDPLSEQPIRSRELTEAFMLKYSNEPFRRLVNQASIEKKSIVESNSRIKALKQLREARGQFAEDIAEIMEDQKIQTISSSIFESSPVQNTISRVDFKSPLSISIFEEKSDRVINLSEKKKTKMRAANIKKKIKNMWTSESFKQDLKDLMSEMAEADEALPVLESFMDNHKEILVLSENELEDLILKTTLMIGEAQRSDGLTQLFNEYYNLNETQAAREDYIARNMINEAEGEGDAGDYEFDDEEAVDIDVDVNADDKETKKKKSNDKETTIDEDSINRILKVMNKIKESLEEKTLEKKYIDSFIQSLEDAKVGSMSEGKLKEILDFLGSVYDQAKETKEEE